MHRIYCDSNIYRFLKKDRTSYSYELDETINDTKKSLIFFYSDAHLEDLKNSIKKELLDEDLEIIGRYCNKNYLTYDYKNKFIQCFLATAVESFYSHDYEAGKEAIENFFDFDKLLASIDKTPEFSFLSTMMKGYFNLPIKFFDKSGQSTVMDEQTRNEMDKLIPGYSPDMTLKDLLNGLKPTVTELLTNKKKLNQLRSQYSNTLNRDSFSFDKWGMKFNEKLKETLLGKTFMELLDSIITDSQKEDEFEVFRQAFILLETYNITEERDSQNKLKAFTLDSLNRDASHAYYASYCDYFVTDDKGLREKAIILYNLFELKTKVLSKEEFISMRHYFSSNEESTDKFSNSIQFDLKHSLKIHDHISLKDNVHTETYKTSHPYFNYFNKLQIINENEDVIIALYCDRPENRNFILYIEEEYLINKLYKTFGMDDDDLGIYTKENKFRCIEKDVYRKWTINNLIIKLSKSIKPRGEFIVISIEFLNDSLKEYII